MSETNNTIKAFSIDRKLWGKGALLNDDGTMCCLGHLGRACGIGNKELKDAFSSGYEEWTNRGYPFEFCADERNPRVATELAIMINDSDLMARPEKERRLKVLFRSRGIRLTFRGKYPPGPRKV